MKRITLFTAILINQALFIVPNLFAAEEECTTTGGSTSTQYINSTVTLKILLVEFSDVAHRTSPYEYTMSDFVDLLGSDGTYVYPNATSPDGDQVYGSMHDYFIKMSTGNVTINAIVVNNEQSPDIPDWVLLPQTKAYYDIGDFYNFTNSAISKASNEGLDVDGLGTYIKLVIIYAGNTYWNGGLNPAANFVGGTKYIMSERQDRLYNQENTGDKFSRIGFHCHEFAHLLGIGHSSGSRAALMASPGARNGPGNRSAAPAPINPALRAKKGWLSPIPITGQQQFDAQYSLINPQVFRIDSNVNNDYFLFENRRFNQTMVIGSTEVPDYNNSAFFPPAWPHGSITQGIFVWRVYGGNPTGYHNNGLIFASGMYGETCPEGTPSETDDGVPFPGNCDVQVLSPWSDPRDPYPNFPPSSGMFVPNTKNGTNAGMEILSENESQGYFTVMLYQSNPEDAKPSRPKNLEATFVNNHPYLTWDLNTEPDLSYFEVWKKRGSGTWSLLATTQDNFFEDQSETEVTGRNKIRVYYYVKAVDITGKKSNPSNTVSIVVKRIIELPKILVDKAKIPSIYALEQNHPNPFNPVTTIEYGLPEDSFVELRIYDLVGKEIRTLIFGYRDAGFKSAPWDGKDHQGSAVSSGFYICVLQARSIESGKDFNQTRKMVLIR